MSIPRANHRKTKAVKPSAPPAKRVWWATLKERTTLDVAGDSLEKVAMFCGHAGFTKLSLPYMRTDAARNEYAKAFLEKSQQPTDVLVMMDNDHTFQADIVPRLVADISDEEHGVGVVGALAFKRGEPFEPCFFTRGPDGDLHSMVDWEQGIIPGTVIGHAAVAIARWVFEKLLATGHPYPFWRYTYTDGVWASPSEDMWFGRICEEAGITHWCDTRLECPHLILGQVDKNTWDMYLRANPHLVGDPGDVPVLLGSPNPQWQGRNE
jgi:hypothetical protein